MTKVTLKKWRWSVNSCNSKWRPPLFSSPILSVPTRQQDRRKVPRSMLEMLI